MTQTNKPLKDQAVLYPGDKTDFADHYPGLFNGKHRWFDTLANFLFPARCLLCHDILPLATGSSLCSSCQEHYRAGGQICPQCEGFFRGTAPCSCLPEGSPLQALFTISLYDQNWRRLIHDLKYRNRRAAARPLGIWLAREIINQGYCTPDLVVPVPLHRLRKKERGYNQSALLAHSSALALNIPCDNLLVKDKPTRSQTAVSRCERHANIRGVFKCAAPPPPGTRILLIDDVYSTGNTMKEAATVLSSRGARVFGAVIAYNPHIKSLQRSGFYAGLDQW